MPSCPALKALRRLWERLLTLTRLMWRDSSTGTPFGCHACLLSASEYSFVRTALLVVCAGLCYVDARKPSARVTVDMTADKT